MGNIRQFQTDQSFTGVTAMSDDAMFETGLEAYKDILTTLDDEALNKEKVEEINRMLAKNVELFNANQKPDLLSDTERATLEKEIQRVTANAQAVLNEIHRRATENGLTPTREQMEEALNRGRMKDIDSMIDMGGQITDLLSNARSLMLNLASVLPTEERFDPRPQKSYSRVQMNAYNAADLLVEAWQKTAVALATVKSGMRYVQTMREELFPTPTPEDDPENEWDDDNFNQDDRIPF